MTIKKYTPDMEITVGMVVTFESMLRYGIASFPAKVCDTTASCVYVNRIRKGEVETRSWRKLKRLITFVCDSEEEALRVIDTEIEFNKKVRTLEDAFNNDIHMLRIDTVTTLLK